MNNEGQDDLAAAAAAGVPAEAAQSNWLLMAITVAAMLFGYVILPGVCNGLLGEKNAVCQLSRAFGPLTALVLVLFFCRYTQGSFRGMLELLRFNTFPWKILLWGLPFAVLILAVSIGVTVLWESICVLFNVELQEPPSLDILFKGAPLEAFSAWFSVLILAPLFEEIMFRRVICDELRPLCGRWAIWISSILFAMIHLTIVQLPGLTVMALIWQRCYDRSGSLWSSVILHFFNNFLVSGSILFLHCRGLIE